MSKYLSRFGAAFAAIFCAIGLAACGGAGGGGATTDAEGNNLVATAVQMSAPLSTCPDGGTTVQAGIDANLNSRLDTSEVTSTQHVCSGAKASKSLSTLVMLTDEAPGANCAAGGKKISVGLDTNGNAVLDAAEVTSTDYVCNGTAGQNGTNGTNGLNSLLSIVPESAGAFCAYGGNKISSGVDTNANGVLDANEVTASYYVCDGAPGAPGPAGPGLTWVDVTGTSVQAASNTGYLANNAAQVTITLPAAPVVGDVVQVSGIGAGGWKITQAVGQRIITKDLSGGDVGETWRPRETNRNWYGIASSADGSKLIAADIHGYLYTSADFGVSWTARMTDANRVWYSVASSEDGSKLIAGALGDALYTSTDSGVTWTARGFAASWISVASSADGSKLVASNFGQLYTSTDSGVTWTARGIAANWISVASSADGSKLVAAATNGNLYTSTDSGVTWTPRELVRGWQGVASSADGSKLVAVVNNGNLFTSIDSGVTWTGRAPVKNWGSVASSADGTKLVASAHWDFTGSSQIYTSADSGASWTAQDTFRAWNGLASSASGDMLVAIVGGGGQIYTSTNSTTPGTTGSLSGVQYDAVALQYIGNNTFMMLSHEGALVVQ